MQQDNGGDGYMAIGGSGDGGGSILTFPELSQLHPWGLPPVHAFNPVHFSTTRDHDPLLLSAAQSSYGGLFNLRPSSTYDGADHQLRLISQSLGHGGAAPFGLHAELQKLTAQEIMDAKALAASKSHSEAERKRRERINNHLAKLRSLLPSTTKTDKASLLAEVIQHVKELKRQTCVIAETNPVPTETDELTVDNAAEEDGRWVIKASICCEDRPDLLPELIKTLKSLRLRTLRAEITTLGGRVRNVLFITGGEDEDGCGGGGGGGGEEEEEEEEWSVSSIHEALRGVMERNVNGDEGSAGSVKRQRTNATVLHHYRSSF